MALDGTVGMDAAAESGRGQRSAPDPTCAL